ILWSAMNRRYNYMLMVTMQNKKVYTMSLSKKITACLSISNSPLSSLLVLETNHHVWFNLKYQLGDPYPSIHRRFQLLSTLVFLNIMYIIALGMWAKIQMDLGF
ncbi:hypothetical protein ACJX0J_037574, partial [Zea mays]